MEKKKKNKINREVVKSLIFKALHIIGYFSTALLIILAIAMGVNSCNANKKRSAAVRNTENDISQRIELDNPTSYTHYWSRFYGVQFLSLPYNTFSLTLDQQKEVCVLADMDPGFLDTRYSGPTGLDDRIIEKQLDGMYVLTANNDYYPVISLRLYFTPMSADIIPSSLNYYSYRLESVRMRMVGTGGTIYNFRPIRNYGANALDYDNYRSYGLSTDNPLDAPYYNWYRNIFATLLGVQLPSWFTYFYYDYNKTSATSFDTFNPNGLVGFSSDNSVFLRQDWTGTTYDYTFINGSGFIISNGKVYDRITLHYVKLSTGDAYADKSNPNGYSTISGTSYAWYFDSMSYFNSANPNDNVRVCYRAFAIYNGVSGPSYEIIWNDVGFKSVYYYALTNIAFHAYNEGIQLLGTLTPGKGANDIFSLLTQAFTSVIPIFNQTIIPGFTIGALLSIPLVGMVIFAIVKLLKK